MKILLLLLAAFMTVVLGTELARKMKRPHFRIVNGRDAVRDQFPYQVLVHDLNNTFTTSGCIIAPRWVVTIAHVIINYKAFELQIEAGILKRSDQQVENQQSLDVVQLIPHPEYSDVTYFYDICLLRLSSYLIYGPNVQAIPLPPTYYKVPDLATISGWGAVSPSAAINQTYSETLQYANVRILNDIACVAAMTAAGKNASFYDPSISICSIAPIAEDQQSGCDGDSGGPLVTDNKYLVGITSWYSLCENPTIHTNVTAVRQWIMDYTNGEVTA